MNADDFPLPEMPEFQHFYADTTDRKQPRFPLFTEQQMQAYALDTLRSWLAAHPEQGGAVAEGWKLVPAEATKEMRVAAVKFANGDAVYKNVAAGALEIEEGIYGEAYEAMLAATPPAPREQQEGGWLPIESAPKDGSYFLAANQWGVWVCHYQPKAVSGYVFDDPWRSVMLNHWHIADKAVQYRAATQWMPLPTPPASQKEQP